MRIGDNRTRSMTHGKFCELLRRKHGALDVDMSVDKRGQRITPLCIVKLCRSVARSDPYDDAVFYGNFPFFGFSRKNVENLRVLDDEIAPPPFHRSVCKYFHITDYSIKAA